VRVLGVDYGRARIGLALSDEEEILASPLPLLRRTDHPRRDIDRLASLVRRHGVGRIVVGLPLNMDGTHGEMAEEAEAFAGDLRRKTKLPVTLFDERLTTAEAERALVEGNVSRKRRKDLRDSLSAVLILQASLDREAAPPPVAS